MGGVSAIFEDFKMKQESKGILLWLKRTLFIILALCVTGITVVGIVNAWVKISMEDRIITQEQAEEQGDFDCVIVLGCGVRPDGEPSAMLHDRLQRGVALYDSGVAPKILMSGDHGRETYNEVAVMKQYAVNNGVPSENVFMDHAGFSTYETMYRAKEIFCAERVLIVTQEYHLYRALYIAEALGLDAYGVGADYRRYGGQIFRDVREILARVKDFGTAMFKPEPTYLGDAIPVSGSGDLTNDDYYNSIG